MITEKDVLSCLDARCRTAEETGVVVQVLHAELRMVLNATDRLQAIVDKLPKDADGDPIEDGRNYFFPCNNGALKFAAYFGPQPENLPPYPSTKWHKTREAAEAAIAKDAN